MWSPWSPCYHPHDEGDWVADKDRFDGLWKKARRRGNVIVVMGLLEWLNRYDTWYDHDLFLHAKRVVAIWSESAYAERMLGPWAGSQSDILNPGRVNGAVEGSRSTDRWIVLREEEVTVDAHD